MQYFYVFLIVNIPKKYFEEYELINGADYYLNFNTSEIKIF